MLINRIKKAPHLSSMDYRSTQDMGNFERLKYAETEEMLMLSGDSDEVVQVSMLDSSSNRSMENEYLYQEENSMLSQEPISYCIGLFWCIIQGLTRGSMYSG